GLAIANVGVFVGVRNDGDFGDVVVPASDGEADAVNGDGTFRHDIGGEFGRDLHAKPPVLSFGGQVRYAADGVHVAENKVPAEFLAGGKRLFKVDPYALRERAVLRAERSFANRFTGKVRR